MTNVVPLSDSMLTAQPEGKMDIDSSLTNQKAFEESVVRAKNHISSQTCFNCALTEQGYRLCNLTIDPPDSHFSSIAVSLMLKPVNVSAVIGDVELVSQQVRYRELLQKHRELITEHESLLLLMVPEAQKHSLITKRNLV